MWNSFILIPTGWQFSSTDRHDQGLRPTEYIEGREQETGNSNVILLFIMPITTAADYKHGKTIFSGDN